MCTIRHINEQNNTLYCVKKLNIANIIEQVLHTLKCQTGGT